MNGEEREQVDCPVCGLPAEVTQRYTVRWGPDAGDRVVIHCLAGHWVGMLVEELKK